MESPKHFAMLDGLRGISAITVLFYHCIGPFDKSWLTPHAELAVDFFFCLSGFVIGYSYENRLLSTMSFDDFVATRIIRLYPLIIIGLLEGVVTFAVRTASISYQSPFSISFLLSILFGALLLPTPVTLRTIGWNGIFPLNSPSWSLFFELVSNFIFAIFVKRLKTPVMIILLITATVCEFVQAYVLGAVTGGDTWNKFAYGFGRVFFPFVAGLYLFRLWRAGLLNSSNGLAPFAPIVLLAMFLCPTTARLNWIYESVVVVLGFPIIIYLGLQETSSSHLKRFYLLLGNLSYPIYILHFPLVRIFANYARNHNLQGSHFWFFIAFEMSIIIIFSSLVLAFYDEPLRRRLGNMCRSRKKL